MKKILIIFLLFLYKSTIALEPSFKIALLKYNAGGDWYANFEMSSFRAKGN